MGIIEKEGYLYLRHSYRSGKKVITKESYLGKEIPLDIDRRKSELLCQSKKELYEKLGRIKNNFTKNWKKYPESVKRALLIDFSIRFTYNTNAIEGSTITEDETEELLKRRISPNRPLDEVQESIRHAETFLSAINEKKELTVPLIKAWHKSIFSESKPDIAGETRDYNVRVGDYRCPDWQDVTPMIGDFIKWYAESEDSMHPVELAATAHYRFEKIHPFGDGNGRIGRLIINFILHKKRYPLIVVEYKKRESYYKALRRDEERFVNYFVRRYLKVHAEHL